MQIETEKAIPRVREGGEVISFRELQVKLEAALACRACGKLRTIRPATNGSGPDYGSVRLDTHCACAETPTGKAGPAYELRILAEQRGAEARVLDENGVLNLPLFVTAVFDGAIGDHTLPFETQDYARLTIEYLLTQRAGRPLNTSERVKVGLAVALEWNGRAAS